MLNPSDYWITVLITIFNKPKLHSTLVLATAIRRSELNFNNRLQKTKKYENETINTKNSGTNLFHRAFKIKWLNVQAQTPSIHLYNFASMKIAIIALLTDHLY